jgi:DNA-binding transcriptional regulator YhcF (GntR family)
MKIKGYKPSKRCATYIKQMITRGIWQVNERISTIDQLSEKLNVSATTVRNVLKQFERDGIIRNMGSLGFYLVSVSADKFKYVSKNSQYLSAFKTSLNMFTLLNTGGYKIRNWVIKYLKGTGQIIGLNEVSGTIVKTTMKELSSLQVSMLRLEDILSINDPTLFENKKKIFDRQREILPVAKLVYKYKRDLGINE